MSAGFTLDMLKPVAFRTFVLHAPVLAFANLFLLLVQARQKEEIGSLLLSYFT
jgi:hypothetical protein